MGQGRIIVITGLPGTGKQGASGMAQLANRTLEEELELIHPEYDRNILWLPLFLIGITVSHTYLLHNAAAPWIIPIMCRCNIRQSIFFNLSPNWPTGLWRRNRMIVLIMGASHTGKTVLAQKLLEKYKYPYLSIDHLK